VIGTVIKLANDHRPLPERFGYAIDAIRTTEQKSDSASCTADLMRVYKDSAVYAVNSVSYSVVAKPNGEIEVTVRGLP
jgi:hypothetical protein